METIQFIIAVAVLAIIAFQIGTRYILRSSLTAKPLPGSLQNSLNSIPKYYGYCVAVWSIIPAIALIVLFILVAPDSIKVGSSSINPYITPLALISFAFTAISLFFIKPRFNARVHYEKWIRRMFILCAAISVSITAFIFFTIFIESLKFFDKVNIFDFLFGLEWSPQTALRTDQAGSSGSFGMIPVFVGTMLITLIAMSVAIPLGLMSAIYLSEYSRPMTRTYIKPVLEILAGVPTVVYGYFAAITMGPILRAAFDIIGVEIASESALAAGMVMGIMIIPFVMSLSDDVMNAVPRSLREASLGLGATKSETIRKVVIPAALPGIMGSCLLAISRAIGETMIVVMAAGLIAKLTFNPLDSVTTVTAQIVKLLVGDQEFDSAKTLSAFALSLALFVITLLLNFAALMIVKKYRERYE